VIRAYQCGGLNRGKLPKKGKIGVTRYLQGGGRVSKPTKRIPGPHSERAVGQIHIAQELTRKIVDLKPVVISSAEQSSGLIDKGKTENNSRHVTRRRGPLGITAEKMCPYLVVGERKNPWGVEG
jgi:hypothetical protein